MLVYKIHVFIKGEGLQGDVLSTELEPYAQYVAKNLKVQMPSWEIKIVKDFIRTSNEQDDWYSICECKAGSCDGYYEGDCSSCDQFLPINEDLYSKFKQSWR